MSEKTVAELKLTLELLDVRRQLIEAHAQIMQYQHGELQAETQRIQAQLDTLEVARERNRS